MDSSGYLWFTSVDLVSKSRFRRGRHDQVVICEAKDAPVLKRSARLPSSNSARCFNLTFSSESVQHLTGKRKAGNSLVFFGGRVVVGPRWEGFLVSISLLSVFALQLVLGSTIPLAPERPVVCTLINVDLVVSFFLIFLTGLSNPGIVPREEDLDDEPPRNVEGVNADTGFLVPRYLLLNGVCIRQKFCRTCKIYRPPRSNHCSVCDNCVLKFDHHCVALGTCIGLGNYRWFLLLVFALTLLGPLAAWLTFCQLSDTYAAAPLAAEFVVQNLSLFVVFGMSVLGSLAFALLFVYHYFITAHNLTTNEHLKKYYKTNPFDYGVVANFKHCLCYPQELLPVAELPDVEASYRELASTNSECVSDFYDY